MRKATVLFLVFSVFVLTSCAELRYMTASFRKVAGVAPKNKDKTTAIIMMGYSQDTVSRFENDIRALGYNLVGNVTDCYEPIYANRRRVTTEDMFHKVVDCGKKAGAEIVIHLSYHRQTDWVETRRVGNLSYQTAMSYNKLIVDIFDTKKGKWLVHRDIFVGENIYDTLLRALE